MPQTVDQRLSTRQRVSDYFKLGDYRSDEWRNGVTNLGFDYDESDGVVIFARYKDGVQSPIATVDGEIEDGEFTNKSDAKHVAMILTAPAAVAALLQCEHAIRALLDSDARVPDEVASLLEDAVNTSINVSEAAMSTDWL